MESFLLFFRKKRHRLGWFQEVYGMMPFLKSQGPSLNCNASPIQHDHEGKFHEISWDIPRVPCEQWPLHVYPTFDKLCSMAIFFGSD